MDEPIPTPPWRTKAKKPRRLPKQPLSQESIAAAALTVLDRDGIDAVNMRSVAAELETGPASLYAHISDKAELLDLLLERVLGEIAVPTGSDGWRQALTALAHEIRRVLGAHPGIAKVAMAGAPTGPNGLRIGEAMLSIMRPAGFPDQVCAWAVDRLGLYITADVFETTLPTQATQHDAQPYWEQIANYYRSLPADRFPHTTSTINELMSGDPDQRFNFGLDLILDGLARHLPAGSR